MKAAKSSGKMYITNIRWKKSGFLNVRMYVCTIKPLYDDDFENKMLSGADCNKF